MAVTYGFYSALYTNSQYDKIYQSGEMSKLFDGLILDGVYLSSRKNDPANKQFMVSADTNNMKIKIAPGRAWFLGTYTISTGYEERTIDAADSSNDRIDAVVIEVNTQFSTYDPDSTTERYNSIKIVKGTAASSPVKPTMTHSGGIDQYPIAYITVSKGTTAIRPYDIEYVVGKETPYFAWLGERLSVLELYSKWKSILGITTMGFTEWFDSMQRMLDDQGGYDEIVNEIDDIKDEDYVKGVFPKVDEEVEKFNGDGTTVEFTLATTSTVVSISDILVDGLMVHGYQYNSETKTITLESAPAVGTNNVEIYYVVEADSYTIYF